MPTTYEPIATTTLGSAATSISFSSITSAYTDLRLVLVAKEESSGSGGNVALRFNSDTGSNYSWTRLSGDGSTAASARASNSSTINPSPVGLTANPSMWTWDIFSYTGSTNKTLLYTESADSNGSGNVVRVVGLWRNTSAITAISISTFGPNYPVGTTATLYGIKNA
jgi:hypothetical protein